MDVHHPKKTENPRPILIGIQHLIYISLSCWWFVADIYEVLICNNEINSLRHKQSIITEIISFSSGVYFWNKHRQSTSNLHHIQSSEWIFQLRTLCFQTRGLNWASFQLAVQATPSVGGLWWIINIVFMNGIYIIYHIQHQHSRHRQEPSNSTVGKFDWRSEATWKRKNMLHI